MFLSIFQCCTENGKEKKRPNVIFLMIDTLRADALGSYGNAHETSPFLDSLARRGITFETVIAPSSHTKISMATLFTGLIPPSHGIRAVNKREESWGRSYLTLPPGAKTMAESFSEGGYKTYAVSTNPYIQPRFGFGQGFSKFSYIGGTDPAKASAEKVHEVALKWFSDNKQSEKPFFLYLHYMDVHYPYQPPPEYYRKFTSGLTKHRPYYPNSPYYGNEPMTEEKAKFSYMVYLAQLRYLDDRIEEFMASLKKNGFLENTLIVIAGDHGEEFFEHGGFGHNYTVYEEVIHVPLILVLPEKNQSKRRGDLVGLIDVYPTLAEIAGLDVSNVPLQGRSLLDRPGNSGERVIYSETFRINVPRSVRTKRDKLIYNHTTQNYEYYRLDKDDKEKNNLYAKDKSRIEELSQKLHRLESRNILFRPPAKSPIRKGDEKTFNKTLKSLGYLDNGGP